MVSKKSGAINHTHRKNKQVEDKYSTCALSFSARRSTSRKETRPLCGLARNAARSSSPNRAASLILFCSRLGASLSLRRFSRQRTVENSRPSYSSQRRRARGRGSRLAECLNFAELDPIAGRFCDPETSNNSVHTVCGTLHSPGPRTRASTCLCCRPTTVSWV